MPGKNSHIHSAVILGGNGAVGSLFSTHLRRSVEHVVVIDRHRKANTPNQICSDILNFNPDARAVLSSADLVLVTLPESVAFQAWREIQSCLHSKALLVDTLSNKSQYLDLLGNSEHPEEIVSVNPMFAPSLGFANQSTAVIEVRRGTKTVNFYQFMESWGCRLVFLKADEHDRCTSVLQAATHAAILAFGVSIMKTNYDLEKAMQFMPPPHRAMLALLARILTADPETYWEIQTGNRFAEESRRNLYVGLSELSTVIEKGDPEEFSNLLSELKAFLTAEKKRELSQACTQMFKSFHTTQM